MTEEEKKEYNKLVVTIADILYSNIKEIDMALEYLNRLEELDASNLPLVIDAKVRANGFKLWAEHLVTHLVKDKYDIVELAKKINEKETK